MVFWKYETNLEENYLAEVWFELLKSHISVGVQHLLHVFRTPFPKNTSGVLQIYANIQSVVFKPLSYCFEEPIAYLGKIYVQKFRPEFWNFTKIKLNKLFAWLFLRRLLKCTAFSY